MKVMKRQTASAAVEKYMRLSRTRAERELKAVGYPSADQIIRHAKAKVEWPNSRWDEIRQIAEALEKPAACPSNDSPAPRCRCRRHGKFAVASLLALAFVTVIIGVPESRALAAKVYYSLIRLFDNRLVIQPPSQTPMEHESDSQVADGFASELDEPASSGQEMQTFASLQEFEKATHRVPFSINSRNVIFETSQFVINRRNEEWLYTYYSCGAGTIVTTQVWNIDSDISVLTNDSYQQYTTTTGDTVYYSVDKADGSIYALTQLSDSILMVSAENNVPMESVLQIFK